MRGAKATNHRKVVGLPKGSVVPAQEALHGFLRRLLAMEHHLAKKRGIRRQQHFCSPKITGGLGEPGPCFRDSGRIRRHAAAFLPARQPRGARP